MFGTNVCGYVDDTPLCPAESTFRAGANTPDIFGCTSHCCAEENACRAQQDGWDAGPASCQPDWSADQPQEVMDACFAVEDPTADTCLRASGCRFQSDTCSSPCALMLAQGSWMCEQVDMESEAQCAETGGEWYIDTRRSNLSCEEEQAQMQQQLAALQSPASQAQLASHGQTVEIARGFRINGMRAEIGPYCCNGWTPPAIEACLESDAPFVQKLMMNYGSFADLSETCTACIVAGDPDDCIQPLIDGGLLCVGPPCCVAPQWDACRGTEACFCALDASTCSEGDLTTINDVFPQMGLNCTLARGGGNIQIGGYDGNPGTA
jgi:hypothetical protein